MEVAPTSNPPVCRMMDFGKYKYEQNKKTHSAKLGAKATQLKEIKLRPFTDTHDLEVKIRHSEGFLDHGHKVKVVLTFRGRENANTAIGRALMNQFMEKISVHGTIEQLPKMEGNALVMIVVPKSEKSGSPKKAKPAAQKPAAAPAPPVETGALAATAPQPAAAGSPAEKKDEPAG